MGKHILVVDDEAVVLGAVAKALKRLNCTIDSVQSAEEALKRLKAAPYDLVIADLMMPGLDGLELMQRLREQGSTAGVIMITGYPTVRTAMKARQLGAFEYVTKPFTRQELASVVVRALRSRENPAAVHGPSEPEQPTGNLYFIREHSWAKMEPDGTARIGMARAFAATVGELIEVKLPKKDDMVRQGRVCATLRATDTVEHSLHSPLSGRVIETNDRVLKEPGLASRDPEGAGWFIHIDPNAPEIELNDLVPQ
jgi:CheY-like chemotaxis protein/glycine cleavage system H lipoate-binding protein